MRELSPTANHLSDYFLDSPEKEGYVANTNLDIKREVNFSYTTCALEHLWWIIFWNLSGEELAQSTLHLNTDSKLNFCTWEGWSISSCHFTGSHPWTWGITRALSPWASPYSSFFPLTVLNLSAMLSIRKAVLLRIKRSPQSLIVLVSFFSWILAL